MRLAADGEPPIVSANEYCDGSVSIDLDYLDGHPDFLGDYQSMEEAEKHHDVAFIYPITLKAKNCNGLPQCNIVEHGPVQEPSWCPTCKRAGYKHEA